MEILGQATNPEVIQTHLKKLFAGIHSVQFDEGTQHIVAMKSVDGEIVPLKHKVQIQPEVEVTLFPMLINAVVILMFFSQVWLSRLADEMKGTLKELLKDCLRDAKSTQGLDPNKYPSQVLCLGEMVQFTERCEEAMKTNSLNSFHGEMQQQLDSYTNVDMGGGSGAPGAEKDPAVVVLELKLKALILDCIHNIEVIEILEKNGVRDIIQWLWQKQLRLVIEVNFRDEF